MSPVAELCHAGFHEADVMSEQQIKIKKRKNSAFIYLYSSCSQSSDKFKGKHLWEVISVDDPALPADHVGRP